jgi:hypothetical protein
MDIQQFKKDTKSYIKTNFLNLIVKKYVLEQSFITSLYGSILSIMAFNLIKWFLPKPFNKDALVYIPFLVKLNIMESAMAAQQKKIRKQLKAMELEPRFSQVWLGSFDYVYYGRRVIGTIEIKNSQIFTKEDNTKWLSLLQPVVYDDMTFNNILNHLSKYKVLEIPSWNGKITCDIIINQDSRHFFLPTDILEQRNLANVTWEKKLVAN